MKRAVLSLPSKAKPLPKTTVQQNTDFTAEGAPPPGKVGTDVPVTPPLTPPLTLPLTPEAATGTTRVPRAHANPARP